MHLTNIALRWAKRLPKGHIFRGKYRLVKKVTRLHMEKKIEEYEIEEQNMFYLRNPYFNTEQDWGHTKLSNRSKQRVEKLIDEKLQNWKEHRLLGDRFGFLKVSEKWD